ncbi:hypothetical protein [Pseudaestuariivita rosea]|nr:hypothetical protein [Pseudaestuariivita rosea]
MRLLLSALAIAMLPTLANAFFLPNLQYPAPKPDVTQGCSDTTHTTQCEK